MRLCVTKQWVLFCGVVLMVLFWAVEKSRQRISRTYSRDDSDKKLEGPPAYDYNASSSILPASARYTGVRLFKTKPLVIWATEWHMTPIKDTRHFLESFGVRVLDYNLDPWRCEFHDCSAKARLKVLNPNNVLNIDPPIRRSSTRRTRTMPR